ncbi:MAG: radical SAM protein [Planctomycetota bacterium]
MISPAFSAGPRVLLIDLNNFSRFPTLPVGLITAVLRKAGHQVEVFSPLSVGASGIPREGRAKPWGYWDERLRWWSATTPSRNVRAFRETLNTLRPHRRSTRGDEMMGALTKALERGPDVVLVSAYLMYHDVCERIAAMAAERGVPVVVGGPAFHGAETRRLWLKIPGLTGLFAGEAEGSIARLVEAIAAGESPTIPGYSTANRGGAQDAGGSAWNDGGLAPPLQDLDQLPFPDYDDFPWDKYPNRIISMLTGRGCGWGVCRFCSDVVTVAGRTFRTRSAANVIDELRHHRERYGTSLYCFSDLKLNSDVEVWRALHEGFPDAVPGAKWTCAVHVGPRKDEGLSRADMQAASRAGLARVTTGFETGSPRLLDAMRKGTDPGRLAEFLAHASEARIHSGHRIHGLSGRGSQRHRGEPIDSCTR